MVVQPVSRRLSTKAAADFLNISSSTLRRWRSQRMGPPYVRLGGIKGSAIRYRELDLTEWMANNTYRPSNIEARNPSSDCTLSFLPFPQRSQFNAFRGG